MVLHHGIVVTCRAKAIKYPPGSTVPDEPLQEMSLGNVEANPRMRNAPEGKDVLRWPRRVNIRRVSRVDGQGFCHRDVSENGAVCN